MREECRVQGAELYLIIEDYEIRMEDKKHGMGVSSIRNS